MKTRFAGLVLLLASACSPPPPEEVRIAPRTCDRPSSAYMGIGTVYSPGCQKQLLWGAAAEPCFGGTDDQTVFLVNDPKNGCTSTGAIFTVQPTAYRELWTNDPVCHCVEFGTGGPCAERSDTTLLFEYTSAPPVNCYPPGMLGVASALTAMTEAQVRAALEAGR